MGSFKLMLTDMRCIQNAIITELTCWFASLCFNCNSFRPSECSLNVSRCHPLLYKLHTSWSTWLNWWMYKRLNKETWCMNEWVIVFCSFPRHLLEVLCDCCLAIVVGSGKVCGEDIWMKDSFDRSVNLPRPSHSLLSLSPCVTCKWTSCWLQKLEATSFTLNSVERGQ